jgi:monoterpene epsilon-lactone hydrolase
MTPDTSAQRIRVFLPVIRFFQSYMPLPLSNGLLKLSLAHVRLDACVRREAISADGVSCEWIIPRDCPPGRVLLYLHGGGFVYGLTPQHLQMGAYLATKMKMHILMVDYRLAPDHPFPAALEDCITVYGWLLKQGYSSQNLMITGDSAGGNLTITTLMKLRDSGTPIPAAAACLSPVTDLSEKEHKKNGFKDPLLPPKAVKFYTDSYIGHNDPRNPLISPVFGDMRGLPPLLVHVGEDEILREDAIRFASLVEAAGGDVRLEIYARMWHVWQLFLALPQSVQSLDDIAQFLCSHSEPVKP